MGTPTLIAWLIVLMFVTMPPAMAILVGLIGLREVRTGTLHGRTWGLLFLLMAATIAGHYVFLWKGLPHPDPRLMAAGIALGALVAVLGFRISKPMNYPRSRFWLWTQWAFALAFTLAIVVWTFAHALRNSGGGLI